MRQKQWHELSTTQQRVIIFGGALQLALQAAALRDIRRRSVEQINGNKGWWSFGIGSGLLGTLAYFIVGRK
jgi:hypothetical protein